MLIFYHCPLGIVTIMQLVEWVHTLSLSLLSLSLSLSLKSVSFLTLSLSLSLFSRIRRCQRRMCRTRVATQKGL